MDTENKKQITLNSQLIRTQRHLNDSSMTSFILPNGYFFDLHDEDWKEVNGDYVFSINEGRTYDELIGRLTRKDIFKGKMAYQGQANMKGKIMASVLDRRTVFSNHEDYIASKRINIGLASNLMEILESEKQDGQYQRYGSIVADQQFIFVPLSTIIVRFCRKNFKRHTINHELLSRMMSSVRNQQMTNQQIVETASLLSTVQMCLMETIEEQENLMATFLMLYQRHVYYLVKYRENVISNTDMWNSLSKVEKILIPVGNVFKNQSVNIVRKSWPVVDLSFSMKFEEFFVDALLKKVVQSQDLDSMTASQLGVTFLTGGFRMWSDQIKLANFVNDSPRRAIRHAPAEELDFAQKFVKVFVEKRMLNTDILKAFGDAVEWMISYLLRVPNDEEPAKRLMLKLAKLDFGNLYHPGLNRLFVKGGGEMPLPPKTDNFVDEIDFINEHLVTEKKICHVAQAEFDTWIRIFNGTTADVFNNTKYIIRLANIMRITPVENVNDEEKVDQGWFSPIRTAFVSGKNYLRDIQKAAKAVGKIEDPEFISQLQRNLKDSFKSAGIEKTGETLMSLSFGSIADSYNSVKRIISGLFSDMVAAICNLFGVEYKEIIDPTTLFFYYLVWNNSSNKVVKYYILVDICISLGIGDIVFAVFKKLASFLRGLFSKTPETTGQFEDYIKTIEKSSQPANHNLEKEAKEFSEQKEDPEIPNDKSFIDVLFDGLTNATPVILGAAATFFLAALGYQAVGKYESIGKGVVNTMRNITFLSLGLAAMPKIYQNILGVIHYVVDYVKGLVNSEHVTALKLIKRVETWIEQTVIVEELTEKLVVRDISYALKMLQAQMEMVEIQKLIHKIPDQQLKFQFAQRSQQFAKIIPLIHSSCRILLNQPEICHFQIYSKTPGVGKTDVAQRILETMRKAMEKENVRISKSFVPDYPEEKSTMNSGVYPINDTLKHADLYHSQQYGYCDEENVFANPEPDTIVGKMMLLSGFPLISQQASLTDKGRVYAFKALVTNTNTAFPVFQNMLNPEALWRRRHLIDVKVKSEFQKNIDGDLKPDWERISKAGLPVGDHLLFTVLNPTQKSITPLDKSLVDLTMDQILEYVRVISSNHVAVQENRLYGKNPTAYLIRKQYEMMTSLIEDKILDNSEARATAIDVIVEKSRVWAEKVKENAQKQQSREQQEKMLTLAKQVEEDAEAFANMKNVEDDEIPLLFKEEQVSLFELPKRMTHLKLGYVKKDGNFVYSVVQTDKQTLATIGDINFDNLHITEQSGKKELKYTTSFELSKQQSSAVLYHMIDLMCSNDQKSFESMRKVKITEQRRKNNQLTWKEKTVHAIKETTSFLGAATRFIVTKTVKMIGEGILLGFGTVLGIMGCFMALIGIGKLLSPQQVAYTGARDKHRLITIPTPTNVSALYTDDIGDLATQATFKITFPNEDGTKNVKATLIGIQGTVFLANWHTMKHLKSPTKVTVYDHMRGKFDTQKGNISVEVRPCDIQRIDNSDACLIDLRSFRSLRNVLNHFVDERDCENDCENLRAARFAAVLLRMDRDKYVYQLSGNHSGFLVDYNATAIGDKHGHVIQFNTDEGIIKGDSGSLIIHNETRLSGRFAGIMLAAQPGTNRGYCGIITREMLEKTLKRFPTKSKIIVTPPILKPLDADHPLQQVFQLEDAVFESPFPSQGVSKTTGFVKSKIHGTFPVESEPAIQDPKDPRIPLNSRHHMKVSLNKANGFDLPYFTLAEEKWMTGMLKYMYTSSVPGLHLVKVYSTKQAITGIRMKGSTSIDTSTCAGLTYKLERNVVGKKPFINFNPILGSWEIQQRVFDDVQYYEDKYNAGFVPQNFKLEFRKKELVGLNKIYDEPKTRTVGMGNFIHKIIHDKIFKDFFTFVKNVWEDGGNLPFAFGVDPERHWTQAAEHLEFHDYVIELDVKAWESKVSLRTLNMNNRVRLDLIRSAYASRQQTMPDVENIAYGISTDFSDAYVIYEDLMYHKQEGLLSGHPATFMENSEIHYMYVMLICYRILKEKAPEYAHYSFITEHVRPLLAADDILIAVSKIARQFITVQTVVEGYKKLSFEVTAPDKTQNIVATTLEECHFLKNKFRKVEDKWYPVPNTSIVYQLFNWIRDDTELTRQDQFQVNMENAFRFAWWRGELFYEETRERANSALLSHQMSWPYNFEQMAVIMKKTIHDNHERANRLNPIHAVEDFDSVFFTSH